MTFSFFFSSRRRHTRLQGDWSSDVCSSDLLLVVAVAATFTLPVAILVFVPHSLSSQENPAARLVVSVTTDRATYLPGQSVKISVRVTNAGNGIGYVSFGSTCQVSYSILGVDGSLVYDHREHVACDPVIMNWTLGPGDA